MKTTILKIILFLPIVLLAQHKGNFDKNESMSRQNISTSKYLGNSGVYNPNDRVGFRNLNPTAAITIDIKALCNVKATSYTAIFNISQIGVTAEETHDLMKTRIENVKQELVALGIAKDNLVIDVISFVPVYEMEVVKKIFSKKYNEVPKGFQLQQNIHIQFTKTNQFEGILAACAKNEIYNLVKVDYFIKDIHLVYAKLQTSLLKQVAQKKTYYKALGFDLTNYNVMMADDKYCYFPKNFYKSYQAFNSVSFDAIKKKKGVTKVKKLTSYYYQPLTYENYDVVMNPSILEPVVQVGMDIKLQYNPKPKEQKKRVKKEVVTKNKYYVISPDGSIDIKELKTN